jgi:membrane protease YdiL (CAAX protease family)
MLPIFLLSLGLGYVYERTGNLWSAIFMHLFFNAAQFTLFLFAVR